MPTANPPTPEPVAPEPVAAQTVLDFWFGAPGTPGHGQPRAEWFRKDPVFDDAIRQRFGATLAAALAGALAPWWQPLHAGTAASALAAVLVLDQFTRNTGRGTAAAFAGDPQALAIATAMVDQGLDRGLGGVQRQFVYLPFEHAEDLALQDRSVALFTQLARDEPALAGLVEWAERHRAVVARFGRFPHRNAALGRPSTDDEQAYLAEPGAGF